MKAQYIDNDDFKSKVFISKILIDHTKNEVLYSVTMSFELLNEYKVLKKHSLPELESVIQKTLDVWKKRYQAHLYQEFSAQVSKLNQHIKQDREELNNLLHQSKLTNHIIDLDSLLKIQNFKTHPKELFLDSEVPDFLMFDESGKPIKINYIEMPKNPTQDTARKELSFIKCFLFPKKVALKLKEQMQQWKETVEGIKAENNARKDVFEAAFIRYMDLKNNFEMEKSDFNHSMEQMKQDYLAYKPYAIEKYCDLVLEHSRYPNWFPKKWSNQYSDTNHILVVEYSLPAPEQYPSVEYYEYNKKQDQIIEKYLPEKEITSLYDALIYRIVLRTLHELFEADTINAIESICFNGLVTSMNKATGLVETKLILSVLASKEQFQTLNLSNVIPKNAFKYLKGISAGALMDLTPIAPQIKLDRTDKRFIEAHEIIDGLDETMNLAMMSWEDFEHLIREIFEKEFQSNGGEVKITQASSDGGVDAIAFDPDPIRGGKIVIQAKRYNNVVGVSAVRDLYGTVLNEGATKGILVTTSHYGRDSYAFAQDKPITLMNGSNLLSLLEKYGHKATIHLKDR